MKNLKTIRVFLSILFFAAAVGYAFFTPPVHPLASLMPYTQIVPSMLAVSLGAILFWLAATFAFGRVYCASFCPIGNIQDGVRWLRGKLTHGRPPKFGGRYRHHRNLRYQLLLVYIVALIPGFVAVPYVMEPWNMFLNIASIVHPDAVEATWLHLGTGAFCGIVTGAVSLLGIVVWAWLADRDFCNNICPIGTALSLLEPRSMMHIEIDPDKCVNCLKCEEICPSQCVKVVSLYVDDSRCVRCFDCTAICPNDAIRFQINHNRPASPLSRRTKRVGG